MYNIHSTLYTLKCIQCISYDVHCIVYTVPLKQGPGATRRHRLAKSVNARRMLEELSRESIKATTMLPDVTKCYQTPEGSKALDLCNHAISEI